MSPTDQLAQILTQEFANAHDMCTDDAPLDVKGQNAWVAQHLPELEELISDFVAERF